MEDRVSNMQQLMMQFQLVANQLRAEFNSYNVAHINFRIEADGAVTGDLKIKCRLDDSHYGVGVTGYDIQVVLDEWLRRNNFDKRNSPIQIPYHQRTATIQETTILNTLPIREPWANEDQVDD